MMHLHAVCIIFYQLQHHEFELECESSAASNPDYCLSLLITAAAGSGGVEKKAGKNNAHGSTRTLSHC
jgi:hypothetical protein